MVIPGFGMGLYRLGAGLFVEGREMIVILTIKIECEVDGETTAEELQENAMDILDCMNIPGVIDPDDNMSDEDDDGFLLLVKSAEIHIEVPE
jgi:hypothetical protein